MDYFWDAEINASKEIHENSIKSLERAKNDPNVTDEIIQTKMDTIKRTKKYYESALNHQHIFEAVSFDAPAAMARSFRNNNKDTVLFIHSER